MITDRFTIIAAALAPRYRLERLLQSGTAACVYVGYDTALGSRVALKVLHDEMAATVDADRFRAEIGLLAHLRHPHIVPIYDSGDVDGLPYYVMPFIAGETLRARLARLGRLPFVETLRITEDVARALQFAHRHRIVHRDIKPENIILENGRALVLDFGIALALDAVEVPRRTLPGLTLGTVQYMSPEQVDAERPVDGRSDIYSLACVVYEMLCGHPPFTGGLTAVMRRHLAAKPRPIVAMQRGVAAAAGAVLARALEKSPDARYPTAGAFASALRAAGPRLRVVGRRIAVAAFVHATTPPLVDAFSDGVGEEVASALEQFSGVVLAAECPTECLTPPDGVDACVAGLARVVDADTLLIGDTRHGAGGAVTISAALYDARSGRRTWSGCASGARRTELAGVSRPARDIATAIARSLGVAPRVSSSDSRGIEATPLRPQGTTNSGRNGRSAAH